LGEQVESSAAMAETEMSTVSNAWVAFIHALEEARHHYFGFMYSIAQGATRPTDGRGRPRKSEQATRCFESSPATLRSEASR
jgi:hypothetical protein